VAQRFSAAITGLFSASPSAAVVGFPLGNQFFRSLLETQAKKGVPSRSEITDAAMDERAEWVMLNKEPTIVTAKSKRKSAR
jgi:hypothetical protein